MSFRDVEMGRTVREDPKRASRELAAMMRVHESNMGLVAKACGVHRETLGGWFDKLEAAGFPVAGRGAVKVGRKPKQKAGEAPRGRVRRAAASP